MARFKIPRLDRQQAIFAAVLILLVYLGVSTLGVIAKNYRLQQRVDELTAQNELLRLQNQQLEYEITYFQTDAFVEMEAREKLGLQAPGEQVVIFPDRVPGPAEPPEPEPKLSIEETVVDNLKQWLYFLFRLEV